MPEDEEPPQVIFRIPQVDRHSRPPLRIPPPHQVFTVRGKEVAVDMDGSPTRFAVTVHNVPLGKISVELGYHRPLWRCHACGKDNGHDKQQMLVHMIDAHYYRLLGFRPDLPTKRKGGRHASRSTRSPAGRSSPVRS